jgi:Mrp family chromosome partitioning ATPase
MTQRELPRAELPTTAPDLLAEANIVALVVLKGGERPSEEMAWELAAAVARAGRRVALVDLCLEDPLLDGRTAGGGSEGVVDAFLYGASLQHVAVEQDVPGLHLGASAPRERCCCCSCRPTHWSGWQWSPPASSCSRPSAR